MFWAEGVHELGPVAEGSQAYSKVWGKEANGLVVALSWARATIGEL